MGMNWMIDGVRGDLYRAALGYRPLTSHGEAEHRRVSGPRQIRNVKSAILRSRLIREVQQGMQARIFLGAACWGATS
jgi:hypothetical protein